MVKRMPAQKRKSKACFTVVIEKQENGYFSYCPSFTGCYAHGLTLDEIMANIEEAIRDSCDKVAGQDVPIPKVVPVVLTVVEVQW
jgi:predicted RNase H-like HicB family nuclease